ncbi:MAG TPA: methionine adenosyltransferase [Anaerolineae bacterium]|nr:methionine adenosyltransferase [Anaerolineae bacterium]
MSNITIDELKQTPVEQQRVELVERKGTGHPDSICDAIMEQVSIALCREYLKTFGRILHHNIDKSLLVAGRTDPRLGGGTVSEPMRLVFGDRATAEYNGQRIDVGAIAETSAKDWLRHNLRFVDPDRHIVFQNELKAGSPELTDIFDREVMGANDTSAAVGYAPLTETERLVFATERYLNSGPFKQIFPEAGEDVKVMGCRRDRDLILTIALAFVDRFVPDAGTYFDRKQQIQIALEEYLAREQRTLDRISVAINTLDDPARGAGGMYLTVLGTSAEGGDCGQVGRGNKVNGVIALNRPMSTEAAAGKNPVSHVGKIYSLLTHRIAAEIYAGVPGLREVYVWLCSQIGKPINQPLIASAQLILQPGVSLAALEPAVRSVIEHELAMMPDFTVKLAHGELPVW